MCRVIRADFRGRAGRGGVRGRVDSAQRSGTGVVPARRCLVARKPHAGHQQVGRRRRYGTTPAEWTKAGDPETRRGSPAGQTGHEGTAQPGNRRPGTKARRRPATGPAGARARRHDAGQQQAGRRAERPGPGSGRQRARAGAKGAGARRGPSAGRGGVGGAGRPAGARQRGGPGSGGAGRGAGHQRGGAPAGGSGGWRRRGGVTPRVRLVTGSAMFGLGPVSGERS